ncbi:MAG: hypothetical protein PHW22_01005 [Bacilli bacterium]|nr:hypothetical protein [Bacilli bacterium]
MKRMILVTPNASLDVLNKYLDSEIIGLDEGIDIARSSGARISLAVSSFKNVDLQHVLTFLPKEKVVRYSDNRGENVNLKVINFLFSQGADEVVLLDKLDSGFKHYREILLTLKEAKGAVSFQDDINLINYYAKGSHIISKQGYDRFYVVGFPSAVISMEHVSTPVRNIRLNFTDSKAIDNTLLERVAVLKVNEGGVLLVLAKNA